MSNTNLNVRIDKDIKKAAEEVYAELGFNMSTAINMFLRASIRKGGIPFDLKLDVPNKETLEAIEEGRRLAMDPSTPLYDNMEDLRRALEV
ncbi:type II toxin-antitoxin system RelB/DinJ family antitoxin [Fenollaria massiliensis]|uniref:Type II toxin-antitoxin system RelB/DinJ family antitoxin n=1 Tax=Fenollaria massiliensis TaxID=938288 RepID=A0A9E7DJL3_9FIRM|nr:type II toxin-antitoxin system RelB/DinJ family antitoxin [Fenollaria massiliensis]UQK59143.1 type II toxin-antitoxin system RelB/DinJ family antitoxin [Fenollaria massiliensis]